MSGEPETTYTCDECGASFVDAAPLFAPLYACREQGCGGRAHPDEPLPPRGLQQVTTESGGGDEQG